MSQSNDCIFCKIVKGEIPSTKIFEDDDVLAFMDIYPITEGHCLLIPKKHYVNLFDVDLDLLAKVAKKLAELARKVNRAFSPDGVLTACANGPGAGQEVPHLHFHVIPRNEGADFGFQFPESYHDSMAPREELERIAKTIRES